MRPISDAYGCSHSTNDDDRLTDWQPVPPPFAYETYVEETETALDNDLRWWRRALVIIAAFIVIATVTVAVALSLG